METPAKKRLPVLAPEPLPTETIPLEPPSPRAVSFTARKQLAFWNLTYACDLAEKKRYCAYCFQKKLRAPHPSREQLTARTNAFIKLFPGKWRVKLSGGELFDMPGFVEDVIAPLLERTEHEITAITNLSYLAKTLEFIDLCGSRLVEFSTSLHLPKGLAPNEVVAFAEDFLRRAVIVRDRLRERSPACMILVNLVLVPWYLRQMDDIRSLAQRMGIKLLFQALKLGTDPHMRPYQYTAEERDILESTLGLTYGSPLFNPGWRLKGYLCSSGVDYIVILPNSDIYPCHESVGSPSERIGSLDSGMVRLRAEPRVCPFDLCSCGVVIANGFARKDAA